MRLSVFRTSVLCLTLLGVGSRAEEGMWMPQQIPDLAPRLNALGFSGDPKEFADLTGPPMGAVVSLGGCSASFVSPDGLIVTNHHCVQGALQYNSTPERNLLKDGYLAPARADELWGGPGSRVLVTTSFRDVTEEITGRIDPRTGDSRRQELIERAGLRCRVAGFFDSLRYFEIAQLEIQDVRLVWAPPEGIGNFGGETDNWQWPRHTGDFSLLRAWVSPSGAPAPHSKDNVPYHPRQWLKVSPEGASPGDLVFVVGYPGRTYRHLTYAEVKEAADWLYPRVIRRNADLIAVLQELGRSDPKTAIRVAQRKRGLNNTLTNRRGMLEGFVKGGLLAKKEREEKELLAWIAADPGRQREFGDLLPALNLLQARKEATRERDAVLNDLLGILPAGAPMMVNSLLNAAHLAVRLAEERPKRDLERAPEFQERNWERLKETLQRFEKTYDPKADRALLRYTLREAARLGPAERIEAVDRAISLTPGLSDAEADAKIDAFLDRLYAGTRLGDPAVRLALVGETSRELSARKDTALDFVRSLEPLVASINDQEKAREGAKERLGPRYMKALLEKSGGFLAPDANGTLRVTFGRVLGVPGRDGVLWLPQTTLRGIVEKNTGEGDFDAPKSLLDAIAALRGGKKTPYLDPKLGDVPVDFLSTVDTTGGNSGSPTLNAKGEVVGLLFDGTFDTVASDYLFDPVRTRSIHADTRDMLFVLTEVAHATNILQELGIAAK